MHRGYIKLWRKIEDNFISHDPLYFSLFIWLLLLANHKEQQALFNGKVVSIKKGQVLTGRNKLVQITGINRSKIERILKHLKSEHMIEQQVSNRFRIISIANYEQYQDQNNAIRAGKRATSEQPVSTNKNEKNEKNNSMQSEIADGVLGETTTTTAKPEEDGESTEFVLIEWLRKLAAQDRKDLKIIAWYIFRKGLKLKEQAQAESELKRNLRTASKLLAWNSKQLENTVQWLEDTGLTWTLETLAKHVAEYQDYGDDEGEDVIEQAIKASEIV